MGLRAKFNLSMLVAFVIGLGLAAAFSYKVIRDDAQRAVAVEAGIMMEAALAIRDYTAREIQPLLADSSSISFLPHTIPSFAAQSNMRRLQKGFPDYVYREPTTNPTNPDDRANAWEQSIIDTFRGNAELKESVAERETPSGLVLEMARPMRLTNKACLTCHSVPEAAPASMIDIYGSRNGFDWRLGDVIGIQLVSVPLKVALERANRVFLLLAAGLSATFALTLLIVNVLLHFSIIRPVRRISDVASAVSLGKLDEPEYVPAGKDEIASLATSFNRMRRSLANALTMLEVD